MLMLFNVRGISRISSGLDILNVMLHHMIQISVIIFLAVVIISAKKSSMCLFTEIYIFIRMRYFL